MKSHFMVSSCDGGLYDTRRANWHKAPPLREKFEHVARDIENTLQFRAALRVPFAFPGGYEFYYVTSDGGAICHSCARANYRSISDSIRRSIGDGWRVVAVDSTADCEEHLNCDHCSRVIFEGEEQ